MGIFDHRKTWTFETSASPEDCLHAFVRALTKGGPKLLGSHWSVTQSTGRDGELQAVATYQGRGGMVGVMSMTSERSASEQTAAIGSTLAFRVTKRADGGRVLATMAMTETTSVLIFFIADARFFRSAMNRVARTIRAIDPVVDVVKS